MTKASNQPISKASYLENYAIQGFTEYLTELINGASIVHSFTIRDKKLPKNDPRKKSKTFTMDSLEAAFNGYWWDHEGYESNAQKLNSVQKTVRSAMSATSDTTASSEALHALREVLKWGAGGTGQKLYTANESWAINQSNFLADSLRMGCSEMSSDTPNLQVFKPSKTSIYARMNAGFTKYYALACDDVIIYDGRVGAALGLLAREFCKKII